MEIRRVNKGKTMWGQGGYVGSGYKKLNIFHLISASDTQVLADYEVQFKHSNSALSPCAENLSNFYSCN